MLQRKAISLMKEWQRNPSRKPLIVQGPRQVGKTFAVRTFAAEEYDSLFELNFLESPSLKEIFNGDLSADSILMGIRLNLLGQKFVAGRTLIFLDELQECPSAATALKFLSGDSRFDVIASGSALGMLHGQVSSWPVGHVEYLDMSSLDFEEFLWACGVDKDLTEALRGYAAGSVKIPDAVHRKLMGDLRRYMVTGGMPDVVNAFIKSQDYEAADAVQRRIYRDYVADIAHYAEPDVRLKAQRCWESIPQQLSKDNHKFQYETVEHRGTARKFGSAVEWLTASGMALRVENTSAVEYPLQAFANQSQFRLYPCDIGLLISTYDFSLKRALLMDTTGPESIVVRSAKGAIYEALAAEMLVKRGIRKLHFHRDATGSLEIEFLFENAYGVVPVEIKAGHNKSRSLDRILADENIRYGYKFADQNAGIDGKRITLPLYMLMFFNIHGNES